MTAKDLVLLHARFWKERYGENLPISWGKSLAQAKRLLSVYEPDKLAAYLRYYCFDHRSSFADRTGRSFGAFISELPGVIAAYTEDERKRNGTNSRVGDMERLVAARSVKE